MLSIRYDACDLSNGFVAFETGPVTSEITHGMRDAVKLHALLITDTNLVLLYFG